MRRYRTHEIEIIYVHKRQTRFSDSIALLVFHVSDRQLVGYDDTAYKATLENVLIRDKHITTAVVTRMALVGNSRTGWT